MLGSWKFVSSLFELTGVGLGGYKSVKLSEFGGDGDAFEGGSGEVLCKFC